MQTCACLRRTHWCYSPLLWDSLLDPFYRMVVDSREL